MSEHKPPGAGDADRTQPLPEPPPLDAIRVKGARARGLNKRAIVAGAGGGLALVLGLASGAFTGTPTRGPADTRPILSDPARPDMAKGAIRALPADYTQVRPPAPALASDFTPRLGPPLPGDIAAFAQSPPDLRSYSDDGADAWPATAPGPALAYADTEETEAATADRAGLFFTLREAPPAMPALAPPAVSVPKSSHTPLTAFAPDAPTGPAAGPASDRALFPGAVIPASLITGINSDSPGAVIAQVTQDIHDSATGRTLLIPQGARLIGVYRSPTGYGQSRIAILWSALIMPDGREVPLGEAAVDPSGAAGIAGSVDNRWGDVFGAAALGTLITIGAAAAEEPQFSNGGIGLVSDPVNDALADGVQRTASTVTNRVVDRGLALPPTIRIPAGARISVIVTRRSSL